jgi:hypothetical protein
VAVTTTSNALHPHRLAEITQPQEENTLSRGQNLVLESPSQMTATAVPYAFSSTALSMMDDVVKCTLTIAFAPAASASSVIRTTASWRASL